MSLVMITMFKLPNERWIAHLWGSVKCWYSRWLINVWSSDQNIAGCPNFWHFTEGFPIFCMALTMAKKSRKYQNIALGWQLIDIAAFSNWWWRCFNVDDDDNGYEYDDIDWCIAKQWPYNGLLQSLTGGEFGIFCHLLFSYWCFWILKIWHILVFHILPPVFSLRCIWLQRFKDLPHFGLACCPLWLILPPTPFLLPSRYKIGLVSLRLGLLSDFRTLHGGKHSLF